MGIIITVTRKITVIPNTWPLALLSAPQSPRAPAVRAWEACLELTEAGILALNVGSLCASLLPALNNESPAPPTPPNPVLGTGPAPHL